MKIQSVRSLFMTGVLVAAPIFSPTVSAQGFLGMGGEKAPVPQITLARAEIAVDVPTPMQGNDFDALLAQATAGNGISASKEAAIKRHSEQLRQELDNRLREFFADEEVPLVASNHSLTLHSFIDVSVVKQLSGLKNATNYELERGNLTASGDFHLRIQDPEGKVLKERRIDIAELRLQEKYQVKTPHDGSGTEDNTGEKVERIMRELVDRLMSRIDDDLEADALRELTQTAG